MKENSTKLCRLLYFSLYLSLASCLNISTETDVDRERNGDSYLSLDLSMESILLPKTYAEEQTYAREHRVDNLWILLYNTDEELEYKFVLNVNNYSGGSLSDFSDSDSHDPVILDGTGTKLKFQTIAKSVKKQDYRLVVLVNPDYALRQLNLNIATNDGTGKKLSALLDVFGSEQSPIDVKSFGNYQSGERPFFMSNANGIADIQESSLRPTQEEAHVNPVRINVDRLLAKVVVNEDPSGVRLAAGTVLESLMWYPDVINKKTFLIRKFADYPDGTPETSQTSSNANREKTYATDPNFSGGAVSEFLRNGDGVYNPVLIAWNRANASNSNNTCCYLPENTMSLEAQKKDYWMNYTSQVVVHANVIYQEFLQDPVSPDDPGRNYYSYNKGSESNPEWKVFTHEQVVFWLQRGFPAELTGLKEKVEANIEAYKVDNGSGFNFKSATPPSILNEVKTLFGISFHPQGLNVYKVPIKHFTNTNDNNPRQNFYGYHGVVRNNVYNIYIKSITGPGTGIEWDSHFISAEITVTPWYIRDIQNEIHLGYDD